MKDLIFLGKLIAFLSFGFGTILVLLFLFFEHSNDIGKIGLYFTLSAFVINLLLFTIMVVALIINKKHRIELLKTCGIMLLNIPIAMFYLYMVIYVIELNSKF